MTPKEIHDRINAFAAKVGPDAYVSVSLQAGHRLKPVCVSLYPDGISVSRTSVNIPFAATFEEAFELLETKWTEHQDTFHADTIRKMALEIIDHTHRNGRCFASALRMTFTQPIIDLLGDKACALAGEMAAGAPFTIETGAKSNALSEARFAA